MNAKDYRRSVEESLRRSAIEHPASAPSSGGNEAGLKENWERAIQELSDSGAAPTSRSAALRTLQSGSFLVPQFAEVRPSFIAALREAATTGDDGLRRSALDLLSNLKDEFARQKLTDGLSGQGDPLVPTATALGFLARDDHHGAADMARHFLSTSADRHIREQAVRLLSADGSARALLSGILKDKDEFREVRRASAAALRNLDPAAFVQDARQILADGHDFADIKATVGGALERSGIEIRAAEPPHILSRLIGGLKSLFGSAQESS